MPNERNVAVHEAGHAVVAWYLGWRPTFITLANETVPHGESRHDRIGVSRVLPAGLLGTLVDSCAQVIQHAAGSCAELAIGAEHDDCGWNADFKQFGPIINAVAKICGYSYDHCWDLLSGMTREILAEASVWSLVDELAARLLASRAMTGEELDTFFAGHSQKGVEKRLQTLIVFVDTPQARVQALLAGQNV